ncbi:hypothetical protein SAMN05421788_10543 [Filimonas lacunae]|uniref:Uncharacterized protein n=1 Tax=Filimonas lacunae TaxID=477680 RepID=A0A1N7QCQ4_9BACT|nr:hypothetical protein SAMN05421788_10543 [Filimonas lacunae]
MDEPYKGAAKPEKRDADKYHFFYGYSFSESIFI